MARRNTHRGRAKRASARLLRAQIWVESAGGPAINDAGADLLDQIHACGSLSEAARRLRFSYRRAWMLVDAANRRWPAPLAVTATGGRRGGGTRLTPTDVAVLHSYRDLQLRVEHLLDEAAVTFAVAARQG